MSAMQAVRVHDPDRRPANWTELIGREQFVAWLNLGIRETERARQERLKRRDR
jgi:hypothetical protein